MSDYLQSLLREMGQPLGDSDIRVRPGPVPQDWQYLPDAGSILQDIMRYPEAEPRVGPQKGKPRAMFVNNSNDSGLNYLDDIQGRLDAAMAKPVQGDYQQGPGALSAYWDLLKQGLGDYADWRTSKIPHSEMDEQGRMVEGPEDQQNLLDMLMGMGGGVGGIVRKVNPWAKTGLQDVAKRPNTNWNMGNPHWKSPLEGVSNTEWVQGKSQANDVISDLMSRFTPQGERMTTGKKSTVQPWEDVMANAGITLEDFGSMGGKPMASPVAPRQASSGPIDYSNMPSKLDWSAVARETGMTPEEITRLSGRGQDFVWPETATSIWKQPAYNVLAELVNRLTPSPVARAVKSYQGLPEGTKGSLALALAALVGGSAVSGSQDNGRFSGGAEAAQVKPGLRAYVNPEQQRMVDEGIAPPPQQERGSSVRWGDLLKDLIYDTYIRDIPAR